MYITLKGIGKIVKILLICKFLNFTGVFIKKELKFPKFACNFPCVKFNFSLTYTRRTLLASCR